jgi:hypothetical protein
MRASRLALLVAIFATSTLGLLKGDVPGVATGTWQPAAPMTSPRGGAATVLLDGGSVVVTGGSDASGSLASVEVFDGTQFSGAPPMSVARTGHAAVLLHDGRVLVVGGKSEHAATPDTPASAEALAAAEAFSADTWTAVGSLTDARWGHTATVLDDGRVLIAGGENALGPVSSVEILDPATGEFTIAGTLASARTGAAAARLADGRVLVAGGFDGTNVLSSIDVFTPSTGTVASLGSLDVPRAGLSATTLLDGKVLFFGGFDGSHELATSVVFDPVTGTLTPGATSAVARRDHQAFLLPNNNAVLIVGGVSSDATLPRHASSELVLHGSVVVQERPHVADVAQPASRVLLEAAREQPSQRRGPRLTSGSSLAMAAIVSFRSSPPEPRTSHDQPWNDLDRGSDALHPAG